MNYILENYNLKPSEEINKPFNRRNSVLKNTNIYLLETYDNYTLLQYECKWFSIKTNNKITIFDNKSVELGYIKYNRWKRIAQVYDTSDKLLYEYCIEKHGILKPRYNRYIKIKSKKPSSGLPDSRNSKGTGLEEFFKDELISECKSIFFPTEDKLYKSSKNAKFVKINSTGSESNGSELIFQLTRNSFPELNTKSNMYTIIHSNFFDLFYSYSLALCCIYF